MSAFRFNVAAPRVPSSERQIEDVAHALRCRLPALVGTLVMTVRASKWESAKEFARAEPASAAIEKVCSYLGRGHAAPRLGDGVEPSPFSSSMERLGPCSAVAPMSRRRVLSYSRFVSKPDCIRPPVHVGYPSEQA